MRRRNLYDPLKPIGAPTWLVVRNRYGAVLECRELAPHTDLRAVLRTARSERRAAGWDCDEIGRACSVLFATRAAERIQIGIERYDPAGPGPPAHSDPRPPERR